MYFLHESNGSIINNKYDYSKFKYLVKNEKNSVPLSGIKVIQNNSIVLNDNNLCPHYTDESKVNWSWDDEIIHCGSPNQNNCDFHKIFFDNNLTIWINKKFHL
jgi:hypothetical protein